MADTWSIMDRLRPRARPDGIAPEPARPHGRPEADDLPQEVTSADDLRPRLRPDGLGTVPESVQDEATVAEALPLDRTTLIGLFNGPDGDTALLRLASGSIVKVAAGETVDGGRITAIDEDGLRLRKGSEEILLTMPG